MSPRTAAYVLPLVLAACAGVTEPSVADVTGEYTLALVDGRPPPVNYGGRLTVFDGSLTLFADLRYVRREHRQTCAVGECNESDGEHEGTWILADSGRIYADGQESSELPSPRYWVADGRTITICPEEIVGGCAPSLVYERQ